MKKRTKITKEELRKITAGARRAADVEMGFGIDRKNNIFIDRKKKNNKWRCRSVVEDEIY